MAHKTAPDYQPLTPPLTWAERLADMLVMGVIIFWFSFLGVVPQKGRPQDLPGRPSNDNDNEREGEAPRLAAE
jgi:hypothetical protein